MSTSHVGSRSRRLGHRRTATALAVVDAEQPDSSAAVAASGQHGTGTWNIVVVMTVLAVLMLGLALVIGGPQVSLVPADTEPEAVQAVPGAAADR